MCGTYSIDLHEVEKGEMQNAECKMQNAKMNIQERTFNFACRIVRLYRVMWHDRASRPFAYQLVDAGTSVGSNLEKRKPARARQTSSPNAASRLRKHVKRCTGFV